MNDAETIFNLLMLLVLAIGQFLLYRSVPQSAVENLLKEARRAAEQTKWSGDDVAVGIAERIIEGLQGEKKEQTLPQE